VPPPNAVVSIDDDSLVPTYAQIFEQIRALIERGEVRAGDALPSVRQLAGDLGVAPNTVARAYADLRAEGWVTSEERRLIRVAPSSPSSAKASRRRALGEAVTAFLASLASRGYADDEIANELRRRFTGTPDARRAPNALGVKRYVL
jgi:DNA-binding transcriptional regulator YhcF (GntR family)